MLGLGSKRLDASPVSPALRALGLTALRRPPVLLLLRPLLPGFRRRADALYPGGFGPIAIAAMYHRALVEQRPANPLIRDVVRLVVCVSILLHGVPAVPFTRWYGQGGSSSRAAADSQPRK